jgi:drug/metabolite transporter (DMT)-like permease
MFIITKHNKLKLYREGDPVNKFLFIRGIAGIFYFASMTYCVGHGAISTVFLSQNLSPMISSVAAYYLFNEKLNKLDIFSLIIGFGGVLLILLPTADTDGKVEHMKLLHKVLIVLLPFMMSALQLLIKKLKTVDNYVINFHYALVSTSGYILWAVYELIFGNNQQEILPKFLSLRNITLLLTASVSHVFALVYWTKAF